MRCRAVSKVTKRINVCMLNHFSHVRLFATPWTVAHKPPLSMDFPGKNTGVGCYFFLQGMFPTQKLNLHLLHFGRQVLYHWATRESLDAYIMVNYLLTLWSPTCKRKLNKQIKLVWRTWSPSDYASKISLLSLVPSPTLPCLNSSHHGSAHSLALLTLPPFRFPFTF